jgi:hypothetical protein
MGQQRSQRGAATGLRLGAMLSRAAALGLVALVAVGAVAARQVVVTLHDGRQLEGQLTAETDQAVTLLIEGVPHAIERQRIADIEQPATFEQEYARRAAAIDPDDLAAQYQLAYWLFENRAYAEAENELAVLLDRIEAALAARDAAHVVEDAVGDAVADDHTEDHTADHTADDPAPDADPEADPDADAEPDIDIDTDAAPETAPDAESDAEADVGPDAADIAADLLDRASVLALAIEQRVKLLREQAPAPPRRAAPADAEYRAEGHPEDNAEPRGRQLLRDRLTPEQINRIRLMEVDLDARPNVRVNRAVWDDLFTRYAAHPLTPRGRTEQTRMRAAEGWRQLRLIFDLRAREYYDQVQILDDPPAMRTFRTQIHHRYVLNYCGTAECHGGMADNRPTRPGGFRVLRLLPNRDDTVYTNFYHLHTTVVGDDEMIDRDQAERSLLIQYGLPRDRAYTPHPETPGWRPGLRDENDAAYRLLTRWIARELYQPAPDYGITLADNEPDTAAPRPQPVAE